MKSSRIIKLTIGLAVLAFACAIGCETDRRRAWGRDTKAIFGDGRFTLGVVYGPRRVFLLDRDEQETLLRDVRDWKELGHKVYLRGVDEYAILDFSSGDFQAFKTIDEAPETERAHLKKLKPHR